MITNADRSIAVLVVAVVGLVLSAPTQAQFSDVTAPELVNLSFTPDSVDLSSGPVDVTVTFEATDDLAGVSFVQAFFRAPTTGQFLRFVGSRVSGDAFNGVYQSTLSLSPFIESGLWTLESVFMSDAVGNRVSLTTDVLAARGLATALNVVSDQSDTTPPQLTAVEFVPSNLDVSSGDQVFEVRLSITDSESGVDFPSFPFSNTLEFRSPSGQQSRFVFTRQLSLISGDGNAGVWSGTMVMPTLSEPGDWKPEFFFFTDLASNGAFLSRPQFVALGDPALPVVSEPNDTTFPELTGFSFSPTVINTSTGFQFVTVTFDVTDDLAGADFSSTTPTTTFLEAGVQFRSPSGNQFRFVGFGSPTLISGTPQNGTWQGQAFFPQFSEDGTWKSDFLQIKDRVRNQVTFDEAALTALGLPTQLVVLRPSLEGDGDVGPGGGTVSDDTFGDDAQVTFPPAAVSETTAVAIDVFLDPLDIPTPSGFIAAGTKFVNIDLTPEPAYPLAAPGLTVKLPLENPLLPGSPLTLYKVDEATGDLVPAVSVFGGPVVGLVDGPAGDTATFAGIASLSTVVGLIPDTIQVSIDVKPGSLQSPINTRSRGVIPVAVLGSDVFDVGSIKPASLAFGPSSAQPVHDLSHAQTRADHTGDVNGDGFDDLVFHVKQQEAGLAVGDTQACVSGETLSGTPIAGCDTVMVR